MIRKRIACLCMAIAPLIAVSCLRADVATTRPVDPASPQMVQQMQAMQAQMNQMQAQLSQTQSQLQQAQTQLKQTQTQVQDNQTQPASPTDTAKAVHDVLEQESSQPGGGKLFTMTAGSSGFDTMHGFYIQTDDGQSMFHPGIIFIGDDAQQAKAPYDWDPNGFLALDFDGTVFSKDLAYAFAIDELGGTTIEYAQINYTFAHGFLNQDWGVELGRFKDPAFKETSDIGDPDGIFFGESIAGDLLGGNAFGGPQINGAALTAGGNDANFHGVAAVDGGPTSTTYRLLPGVDALGVSNDVGVSLRADYKFMGDWIDTSDLTGKLSGQHDLLDIGGGLTYNTTSTQNEGVADNVTRATVDAQYQMAQKITAYGAIYYNHFQVHHLAGSAHTARNDFGGVLEGGYLITPAIQVLARYSLIRSDPAFVPPAGVVGAKRVLNELGVGGNYYFGPDGSWGNHFRIGMDIDYLMNGSPGDSNLGQPLSTRNSGVWIYRGEFQFWI